MTCPDFNRPAWDDFGYQAYTGDGSTTDFEIGFAYLYQENIDAGAGFQWLRLYVGGDEVTDYTFVDNNTVRFPTAPADDSLVEIIRDSRPDDRQVTWTNNTPVNAANLELEAKQFQYLIQELWHRIKALACELDTTTVDGGTANNYQATGDNSTTIFSLSPETGLSDNRVIVTINGVVQEPDTYAVADSAGISRVTFDEAPPTGAKLGFRVFQGILTDYAVADGSITAAKLAACSVTFSKLCLDAYGSNNNYLIKRTGTWIASSPSYADFSDFAAGVRLNRLDQMAAPTANVSMNSHKITNLTTGTASTDAVNKGQMDAAITLATPTPPHCISGQLSVTTSTQSYTSFGYFYNTAIIYPVIPYLNSLVMYGGNTNVAQMYQLPIVITSEDGFGEQDYTLNPAGDGGTAPIRHLYITRTATGFDYRGSANMTIKFVLFTNG
jgi:hypothetical protein